MTTSDALRLGLTPSQTVGPYLHIGLEWEDGPYAVPAGTLGGIWIRGVVTDGAGTPVPDALVETWQADENGRFGHPDDPRGAVVANPGHRWLGRSCTDGGGRYEIFTVRPGPVPALDTGDPGRLQAPHLDIGVLGRGLLDRVVTRLYFPDEPLNDDDPVLGTVPPNRRHTLIARPDGDGLRFDIRLQGTDETVFFAL